MPSLFRFPGISRTRRKGALATCPTRSLTALALAALSASGCVPVFTAVVPDQGGTCDLIEVQRPERRRHRCGTLTVELDGRPASGICLEGSSTINACTPPEPGTDLRFVIPGSWPEGAGTLRVRQRAGSCALLGAFSSRLHEFPFTVTDQLSTPRVSLTADDTVIDRGDSTTLRWNVTGTTTAVRLGTEPVPVSDSRSVSPTSSTTYRLTAENACLTGFASVSVCVNPPQAAPQITGVGAAWPGSSLRVDGRNLAFSDCAGDRRSELLFAQAGRTFPPVADSSPSAGRLEGSLPAGLAPGEATVVARVGTLESAPFRFTVAGRVNGDFRAVTLRLSGTHPCGGSGRQMSVACTGGLNPRCTATFREGTRTLGSLMFTPDDTEPTGAAISPGCDYAVSVGLAAGGSYSLEVRDLASSFASRHGAINLGRGVKVLFSPDDSLVLYGAQDGFRGVGFAAVSLYDLRDRRSPGGGPGPGIACSRCAGSLSGRLTVGNCVTPSLDSGPLTPYRVASGGPSC